MGAGKNGDEGDAVWITPTFARVRKGYDPVAVDAHLAAVGERMSELLATVDNGPDESLDLVLRATKRSIEEALQDARDRADAIVADAHAAATTIRETADQHATRTIAEAETRSRELDARARGQFLEMERLREARASDVVTLDQQILDRQGALRATAADLRRLADELSSPTQAAETPQLPEPVAAMREDGIEIVLSAEVADDS
jgi:cell division septum initiation protein DivIVA